MHVITRRLIVLVALILLPACRTAAPVEPDATATLSVPNRINQTPGVAVDGALVAVSWTGINEEKVADAYVAVSTDGGRTFGSPVRVNDQAGDVRPSEQQAPRIAVRDGMIAVLWTSRREGQTQIRVAVSKDGGRTFAPSQLLSPAGLPGTRGWGSLTIDEGRRIQAVWLDTRIAAAAMAAAKAGPKTPHVHGSGSGPSTSSTRQDLYAATVDVDGRIQERMVATAVCYCCKTAIARRDATTWTAFRDVYPGSLRDITLARLDDASDAGRARVSEDGWKIEGCPEDGPAIAAANGRIEIVWPTLVVAEPMTKGVFHATTTDGRTFSPRVRLDAGAGSAFRPVVSAAEPRGVRAVAWETLDGGTHRIEMRRATGAGEWLPIEVLATGPLVSSPAIAAFADGVVVAWGRKTDAESVIEIRRLGSN